MTVEPGPRPDRPGPAAGLTFDGRAVPVRPGQSIAAALLAAGIRSWRTTRRAGRPRGLFCGIGACYDCLITVDGIAGQRACLTPARSGQRVDSGGARAARAPEVRPRGADIAPDVPEVGDVPDVPEVADVAVVGAGPAGLAAAVAAADAGSSVVVVDMSSQPGGQYWRHRADQGDPRARLADEETYGRLRRGFDAAHAAGRLAYLPDSQVWFLARAGAAGPYELRLTGPGDVGPQPARRLVRAHRVILCPGGYDRQLPVPGWDLPGVVAAGGAQALLKGSGTLAGRRVLVAGTGPFLLPVATGLAAAGARVVGVCEAGAVTAWLPQLGGAVQVPTKLLEAGRHAARLARHRIPYWTRTAVTAIEGTDDVHAVRVASVDAEGRVEPGTTRRLDVDLVALGWGFTPSLELVSAIGADTRLDVDGSLVAVVDDRQRTTVAGVYVAGEAGGVGGADLAVLTGELAGLTAATDRGATDQSRRRRRLGRRIARARAFATALHRAHPVPPQWPAWLTPDTVVCRCEEVTHADLCGARDELGAGDARAVKLLSRAGMGWCQGRVCGQAAARLAAPDREPDAAALRPIARRPLCVPVPLAELAELDELSDPADPGVM